MERATVRTSLPRMYHCEVCDRSFTRKDNLSRHLYVHGEKRIQCPHCSKCYSQQGKLKVHTLRHHTNENQKSFEKLLACTYCSKVFGRSFNLKRHIDVCKKKSVEATKSDCRYLGQEEQIMGQGEQIMGQEEQNVGHGEQNVGQGEKKWGRE